jgi:hypothetical protein
MFTARRVLIPLVAVLACGPLGAQADTVFKAAMDGAQTLPEPIKTNATGTVELRLSGDGKSIAYRLSVEKLVNPTAADVHLGGVSQNGPVVVKLFPHGASGARKGEFSGLLAEGTFTAANLVGPLTGAVFGDLVEELKAGNVYVNVHTNDGVDPPNSGTGDYGLGEIRGQFK